MPNDQLRESPQASSLALHNRWLCGAGAIVVAALIASSISLVSAIAAEDPVKFLERELGPKLDQPEGYELIELNDSQGGEAVVGLSAIAPEITIDATYKIPAQRMNLYVFLVKQGDAWAVSGTANAMTEDMRSVAGQMQSVTAAEMANTSSLTEEMANWIRTRILLTASTDDVLIAHFRQKREVFEAIRTMIAREPPSNLYGHLEFAPPFVDLFKEALIEYGDLRVLPDDISGTSGCKGANCLTLAITFMPPKYQLGYFYMSDPARVPRMTKSGYMVIRPLGSGWYFFRQN